MKTPFPPRRLAALGLAFAALLSPAASPAALLTYDLRVVSSTSGDPVTDPHAYLISGIGEVLTLQLYAIINSNDASHANDGFLRGSGSFLSQGESIHGNMRGDALDGGATLQNNLAPFSGSGAQSGFQVDVDGDEDLDVGSLVQTGSPAGPPWFVAMGADQQTQVGSGAGVGPTEFLIGRTTFTVAPNSTILSAGRLTFLPQIKTDGTTADQLLNQFTIDGVPTALAGNDPNVATISANIAWLPEPSACALALCGAATLAGFRRRK